MTDVLLIIDVQTAILDGSAAPDRMPAVKQYFDEMVARLAVLKATAAKHSVPTVLVQNDGPPDHRLEVGSKGWDIVPSLQPSDRDIVVHKTACDSFHETDLLARLTQCGATRLIVGGCMTQYCVDTTVRRAVTLGFDVMLLADGHCTGDAGGLRQDQIIAHHNATLADVDTSDNVIKLCTTQNIKFGNPLSVN
ncbi:MAG: isochorismatase family protein [Paracoccaceae bacterium]|uniref:isochorismatase family protein n=1 Tax=Rhodobacterales TaxID=204455 RepID=UPI0032985095